jgi:two-component system nitrate/nitrite response regulator NarL
MAKREEPITVLLVDDHEHVLWGLNKLIEGERPRMTVVGKARSVAEARVAIRERNPDVVLLDVFLGEDNSLDYLLEMLDGSKAQVLVLTAARDPDLHRRAIRLGARSVLHKDQPAHALLEAILQVHTEPAYRGAMRGE